ncbi:unnamed protein product [Ilex paraguariensis]|uniref:Protein kinase domain-containing protein n=1 Tax=Ilex paraguariensis TaxID=185542 RepID=A0ABC8SR48_9AQUA
MILIISPNSAFDVIQKTDVEDCRGTETGELLAPQTRPKWNLSLLLGKMTKWYLIVLVFSAILASHASAHTDPLDVQALQDLYAALNSPPQLKGWKSNGGDPCEESWKGVSCSESSVIHISLNGLELSGGLGFQLSNLHSLKQLDLSSNHIQGEIPYSLPLNVTHLDLSYNNLTGDLPSSFGSLTNLTRLFLQSNEFSGSVIFLSDLPLSDLIGGNRFEKGRNYKPWNFPLDFVPNEPNISSPPTSESSAIESYPSHKDSGYKKKRLGAGGIAFMVGGGTLVATCAALVIVVRIHLASARKLRKTESIESSRPSIPTNTARDYYFTAPEESPQILGINSPPMIAPRHLPPIRTRTVRVSRRSFSKKLKIPIFARLYTVAELQSATNSFSEESLLGEGSLGSVYRAEFPNGQIFAVKNINTEALSLVEEEQFLEVIRNAARLKHPNIVTLLGYCVEHGLHLLVYEYVRNLSLDDALHSEAFMSLSWALRLQIAVGVARAVNYLHTACVPPLAHSNLKAANILLDEDLTPRVCDCGLAVLRSLTSNSVKLKASEMAIRDSGYIAPEHEQPGIGNTKGDIYAFGVLLLELLTGKRAFDSSKPRQEQSLVKWASSRLHDNRSLEQMVDPAIKRMISSKALSRYADIVSLCIQPEKEFRPLMSEILESLTCLLQNPRTVKSIPADGTEGADPFERSFRSTNTSFFGSPTDLYHQLINSFYVVTVL